MSDPEEYANHPEDYLEPWQLARRYPRSAREIERQEQKTLEKWERENLPSERIKSLLASQVPRQTIGDRLRSLREKAGLTHLEVARYLGTVSTRIKKWESGEAVPNDDSLALLAEILGQTVPQIRTNVEPYWIGGRPGNNRAPKKQDGDCDVEHQTGDCAVRSDDKHSVI